MNFICSTLAPFVAYNNNKWPPALRSDCTHKNKLIEWSVHHPYQNDCHTRKKNHPLFFFQLESVYNFYAPKIQYRTFISPFFFCVQLRLSSPVTNCASSSVLCVCSIKQPRRQRKSPLPYSNNKERRT